ncbi:thermostable hemolysin, partial [Citrobacter braakii]|uniref:thermostable hemolysin n=1 Tax=Citrobacter braakii TaxID=57706 RepID=UPI00374FADB8
RENYHQVYHASLSRCMPWLLGMYDANGELKAACGVQVASHGTYTPVMAKNRMVNARAWSVVFSGVESYW